MDKLKQELKSLNDSITELESQIEQEKVKAQNNIRPLNEELTQLRDDKRDFALKKDFDSVQVCRRRESNIKFKINAQWNRHSMLKNDLSSLSKKRRDLEYQIKLEEDKIKRNDEILAQMDIVLENYRKTQSLKQAAIDSKTSFDHIQQWYEWGRNNFNETYSYFYTKIIEIDNHFKDLEAQKLKNQMDSVITAYQKTDSLKKASEMADVSYDTVQYWYEWGSRGFGKENVYFFKKIKD